MDQAARSFAMEGFLRQRPIGEEAFQATPKTNTGTGSRPGSARQILPPSFDIIAALRNFQGISLEETNKTASMLKRIDNKYVVTKPQLISILDKAKRQFRILRIDGCEIFSYESCYFDDDGQCFREHQQGRRHRFKVRTRRYVESDMAFFEIKLKGKRGQTEKSREKCDHYDTFAIDAAEQDMLRDLYEKNYGKTFDYNMAPALHVSYRRLTLVSASGSERITIDFNLGFETPSGKRALVGDDFVIIETKTADGRGKSDRIMKQEQIRLAEGCSKYCIGMILTGEIQKYNKFRAIVKTVRSRMHEPIEKDEPSAQGIPGDIKAVVSPSWIDPWSK